MNRSEARSLIAQTFTQAFDKGCFGAFVVNVLNDIDESKASVWNSQYIKDAFKEHVNRYERLGTYTSPEKEKLDILIVHLTKDSKLERARTAIRNFVADHLRTHDEKDTALVAFVSPTEKQWRFSYVKMDYTSVATDSGRVGVEMLLTPARRYSYLVGEGESCHTAQTRFVSLLENGGRNPTLADIEDAFSVEAVTKEFFEKYAELFESIHLALEGLISRHKSIRDEFKGKGINSIDFAKKLMGQVVFLYFLQKKGWLGVSKGGDWGTGPHDFVRTLARGEHGKYDNFFNDILEPLFYDTLSTDRGHEAWCDPFKCRIPFLNGGLFEPPGDYNWKNIDIMLPNKLFTNAEFVDEGIAGTGVLDVFDRYNFTVNEAEPLEKEVAIDPEMLGKVFENLIEENRRKGLGTYYTPREIVHYMCRESLINYLNTTTNHEKPLIPLTDIETFVRSGEQISHYEAVKAKYVIKMPKTVQQHARLLDEKLADITVCDPAVGSGAFPVGMMTEIVRARCALTPYFNDVHERIPYFFKHHAIQNSLYGVDIDAGAAEIAKLRLWLSLVVDEEETKQIKPLPNLDFKIVAGNSLMGFPFKSRGLEEIEKLKTRFFEETDHKSKAALKREIEHRLNQCFESSKKSLGYEVSFDFNITFSEVALQKGGFDILIANPPYIEFKKLAQSFKDVYNNTFVAARGKYDIYVLFIELAHRILKSSGNLAFINPTSFLKKDYGAALRAFILQNFRVLRIVDFADLQVFEGVTNYTGVFFFFREQPKEFTFEYHKYFNGSRELDSELFSEVLDSRASGEFKDVIQVPKSRLASSSWDFHTSETAGVLEKLRVGSHDLSEETEAIFQGIASGKDEVFYVTKETIKDYSLEKELLHRLLKGQNIKRYSINWSGYYVIYPYDDDSSVVPESELKKSFPKIYEYFREKKNLLAGRGYFDKSNKNWYELWNQRKSNNFHKLRIVTPEISDRNNFALTQNFFGNTKTYHFVLKSSDPFDYSFFLGLLNSSAIEFYYHSVSSPHAGGFYAYKTQFLEKIPVRKWSKQERASIVSLVDKILDAKRSNHAADTTVLEKEINRLAGKLYGLNDEEMARIDANVGKRANQRDEALQELEA